MGIEVTWSPTTIFLCQCKYTLDILTKTFPYVTGLLPSPQKVNLTECAAHLPAPAGARHGANTRCCRSGMTGPTPIVGVQAPLPSLHQANLKGVCSATVYKPRTLPLLPDVGLFVLTVTFSPTQSCDALVTDRLPCLPHPLGRLARHRSRVRVGSDTTCHGAITLFPKS